MLLHGIKIFLLTLTGHPLESIPEKITFPIISLLRHSLIWIFLLEIWVWGHVISWISIIAFFLFVSAAMLSAFIMIFLAIISLPSTSSVTRIDRILGWNTVWSVPKTKLYWWAICSEFLSFTYLDFFECLCLDFSRDESRCLRSLLLLRGDLLRDRSRRLSRFSGCRLLLFCSLESSLRWRLEDLCRRRESWDTFEPSELLLLLDLLLL